MQRICSSRIRASVWRMRIHGVLQQLGRVWRRDDCKAGGDDKHSTYYLHVGRLAERASKSRLQGDSNMPPALLYFWGHVHA